MWISTVDLNILIAQSAGCGVEYTDYISVEE